MAKYMRFIFSLICTVGIILWLNGNLQIPGSTHPPFGKLLNPYSGIWSSHTESENGDFTFKLLGPKSDIHVYYDERRVPHIDAKSLEDALFAQGFVEAQNRLFQMFFLTKVARGELSSMFGERTIELDLAKRRWGLTFAAENAVKAWEKMPHFSLIEKYIEGINAYIDQLDASQYPIEFKLLGIKPEKWTALHSALIFKLMSQTLAGLNEDIENTNLKQLLGEEDYAALYNELKPIVDPVIPSDTKFDFDTLYGNPKAQITEYTGFLEKKDVSTYQKGIGSNSWAVNGNKTKSGHPIFCNDPHLTLSLPSIWFECQMKTPDFNTYGVSFPGFPGIMIGFNEHIAWGETNVSQEVSDLYTIHWTDQSRKKYILDGKEVSPEQRIEIIKVKGQKDIIDTVYYTYWGPIVRKSIDAKSDLALRWLVHDAPKGEEFYSFIGGMQSANYASYLQATDPFSTPAQNFGFASTSGDIAMRVNGVFPAVYHQNGKFVKQGDQSQNGWNTLIPKSQVPQTLNPARNFVASANQMSTGDSYPYFYTGIFEHTRNQRINGILSQKESIEPSDMKSMQMDNYSVLAADCILAVKDYISAPLLDDDDVKALFSWNFTYMANDPIPTLFDLFFAALQTHTWDEIVKNQEKYQLYLPEDWLLLHLIKTDPNSKWFDAKDTPEVETASEMINISLEDALKKYKDLKSQNVALWGQHHQTNIHHLMRLPTFSALNLNANGCPDAINANNSTFGPSWRMVVSLDSTVTAWGVYPGGQSGNPTSKYYRNMIHQWVKGEYNDLHFVNDFEKIKPYLTSSLLLKSK